MGLIITTRVNVANRLMADPYFEDIPVLALMPKETISELTNRLNKLTLAGTVIIPRLTGTMPNVFGPHFDKMEIQVGFCENRLLNATGKPVEDVVEKGASLLHGWTPANLSCPLYIDAPTIIEIPPENESDKHKRLIAVRLIAQGGVSYDIPTVETPAVVNAAGTITITCATPGAAIFYRTDGKQPNPRTGSGSTLYTGGFTPGPGVTVKARAFLAGFTDSAVGQVIT